MENEKSGEDSAFEHKASVWRRTLLRRYAFHKEHKSYRRIVKIERKGYAEANPRKVASLAAKNANATAGSD